MVEVLIAWFRALDLVLIFLPTVTMVKSTMSQITSERAGELDVLKMWAGKAGNASSERSLKVERIVCGNLPEWQEEQERERRTGS